MDGSGCEQQSETGWKSRNERDTPLPFITNIPRIDKHKIHNGICRQRSERIRTISPSLGRCRWVVPFSSPSPPLYFLLDPLYFPSPPRYCVLRSVHETALRVISRIISNGGEGYISGLSYDWSRDRCFFLEFEWWPFVFNVSRRSFLLFLNFFFFFLIGIIGNCVIHVFSNRRFKWTAEAGLGSSLGFGMIIFGIGSLLRIPRPVWTPSILGADHFERWLSSTLTSWEGGLLTILAGWLIWGLVIFENCDRFFTLTVKARNLI